MPLYELTTPDGKVFEVDAPSEEVALRALSQEREPLGIARAAARGATVGAAEGIGGLVDILGQAGTSLGIPGLSAVFPPLGQPFREGSTGSFQQGFGEAAETVAPQGEPSTPGEQRAFEVGRGAVLGAPFGPLGALGGAAGDVATGELERAGAGLGLSVAGGAAADITAGLLAKNVPRAARGLTSLATRASREAAEAATKEAVDALRPASKRAIKETVESAKPPRRRAARLPGDTRSEAAVMRQALASEPPIEQLSVAPRSIELPPVPEKAGNINLSTDAITDVDSIKRVMKQVADQFGGDEAFAAARRKGLADREVIDNAMQMGLNIDDLLATQSRGFLSEHVRGAEAMLRVTGGRLDDLLARWRGGDHSDEVLSAFSETWFKHVAVQQWYSGAGSEASRTLRAFKKLEGMVDQTKRVQRMIDEAGGRNHIAAVLDMMQTLPTSGTANRFLREAAEQKIKKTSKLAEIWKANLLTGPQTHNVNFGSNTAFAAGLYAEDVTAALGRAAFGDQAALAGIAGRTYGGKSGIIDGFTEAWHVWRTGDTIAMTRAMETAQEIVPKLGGAIQGPEFTGPIGRGFRKALRTTTGADVKNVGDVIRLPFRALGASDALFRTLATRSKLHQLAYERAWQRGLRGRAIRDEALRLVGEAFEDSPNVAAREMFEEASDFGARAVFQENLGKRGRAIQGYLRDHPESQFVIPFLKTPVNIFKQAARRTPPLSFLSREYRAQLFGHRGRRVQSEAIASLGMGMATMYGAAWMASEGMITGSGPPFGTKERDIWENVEGKQPYSVWVPAMNQWVSYARVEPFASTIGMAVDLYDASRYMTPEEADEFVGTLPLIIGENFISKTYAQQIASLMMMWKDPKRYGTQFLDNFAASLPGGASGQAARAIDPTFRQMDSALDRIRSRVPGLSQGLPAKIDPITGDDKQRGTSGSRIVDFVNPLFLKEPSSDPVVQEMARLQMRVSTPDPDVGGEKLNKKGERYEEYSRLAGKFSHEMVSRRIAQGDWGNIPDAGKKKIIRRLYTMGRAQARRNLGIGKR